MFFWQSNDKKNDICVPLYLPQSCREANIRAYIKRDRPLLLTTCILDTRRRRLSRVKEAHITAALSHSLFDPLALFLTLFLSYDILLKTERLRKLSL